METFAEHLAGVTGGAVDSLLAEASRAIQTDHNLFPNEVEPATRLVRAIRGGSRTVLLAHPMQSGKTNIMRATTLILRALMRDVRALYICANDQLDLRRQNRVSLVPHVELLTRSDRRRMDGLLIDRPTIIFYDEAHFGDGSEMTIQQFLDRHGLLDKPLAVFCGVSATPMTSLDCLDTTVWADMVALEAAGYNSPRLMLERGRIRQATPMFESPTRRQLGRSPTADEVTILHHNEALRLLEDRLGQPRRDGYCLIRAHRWEGEALRAYLERRWGDRVYVVDWNQHNKEFTPETFFGQRKFGMITVVIVQHKARMGTVIDTRRCIFMYEYRRLQKGVAVDTIAQSFIGRACGFNKQDHDALVFTDPRVARAYTLLMCRADKGALFAAFCEARGIKPAHRAEINHTGAGYALGVLEMFEASGKDSAVKIRRRCEAIRATYALEPSMGAVRTVSRIADPYKSGLVDRWGRPRKAFAESMCGPLPGSWSMVVFDRLPTGRQRSDGEPPGKGIILAIRGADRVMRAASVGPSPASMYHEMRAARRVKGQMSLSFTPRATALAAAGR